MYVCVCVCVRVCVRVCLWMSICVVVWVRVSDVILHSKRVQYATYENSTTKAIAITTLFYVAARAYVVALQP